MRSRRKKMRVTKGICGQHNVLHSQRNLRMFLIARLDFYRLWLRLSINYAILYFCRNRYLLLIWNSTALSNLRFIQADGLSHEPRMRRWHNEYAAWHNDFVCGTWTNLIRFHSFSRRVTGSSAWSLSCHFRRSSSHELTYEMPWSWNILIGMSFYNVIVDVLFSLL